jgi:hypothetical protein
MRGLGDIRVIVVCLVVFTLFVAGEVWNCSVFVNYCGTHNCFPGEEAP